ncbi:translation initiation factor 3 (bIF-3) [Paenibacillus taihuensis]|uniref:Translation initiation factor IF-3 n=1 Tax=Paenibacillus taihuensis TaxID=1156355 RepID=A0A3D9S7D4_9BACL|nr:translation initiation factor 3 (bIF-3) [Paenibacillus taihuensis]
MIVIGSNVELLLKAYDLGEWNAGPNVDPHFLFCLIHNFWRWQVISREHQINDEIRAREVRVVGAEGEQLGIKPFREALQLAIDLNMDLVNVAPTAKPPVCRIMDYGKFRYEQQKKDKEARKNQKIVDTKEVWFRANIDENDYQTKFRNVVKFLGEGDKVKCSVRFRGREITHASVGQKILDRLATEVADLCVMERVPKLEGRSMIMILAPKAT